MVVRTAIASSLCTLAGCALVLGGLPEGTSREEDAGAPATDASRRRCWLEGHAFRTTFEIDHRGPSVTGYQVKLVLPTASLIAAGKMRADAADLRVTLANGTSIIPHFVEGGPETGTMTLWARVDLAASRDELHVYYGKSEATGTSSLRDTFVTGVIDDLGFEEKDAWQSFHRGFESDPVTRTNEWSATLEDGKARLRIVRKFATNGAAVGYCQTVAFPAGSNYQLHADLDVLFIDKGDAHITSDRDQVDLWCGTCNGNQHPGHYDAATRLIASGTKTLCFMVGCAASDRGQGIDVTFSRIRLRRVIDPEPRVIARGIEESARAVEASCP